MIHTVGPVWHGGARGEDALLAGCYRRALEVAASKGVRTIAFPAISTGIYGLPVGRAAHIAVSTVAAVVEEFPLMERVVFACFGEASVHAHRAALAEIQFSSSSSA